MDSEMSYSDDLHKAITRAISRAVMFSPGGFTYKQEKYRYKKKTEPIATASCFITDLFLCPMHNTPM